MSYSKAWFLPRVRYTYKVTTGNAQAHRPKAQNGRSDVAFHLAVLQAHRPMGARGDVLLRVTKMTVLPAFWMSENSCITSSEVVVSKLPVGSSAKMMDGFD